MLFEVDVVVQRENRLCLYPIPGDEAVVQTVLVHFYEPVTGLSRREENSLDGDVKLRPCSHRLPSNVIPNYEDLIQVGQLVQSLQVGDEHRVSVISDQDDGELLSHPVPSQSPAELVTASWLDRTVAWIESS